jgi:Ran GTPase-activating protein (RanGAP) involved in mRNA processing and transport
LLSQLGVLHPSMLPTAGSPSSSLLPSVVLSPAFSINQSLTRLDVSNNRIGSDLSALSSALMCANSALRELRLSLNDIGDVGANYVALALRHSTCPLRVLNLSDNVIGPLGAKVLCAALESNTTLQSLDLSWNQLGVSGLGEGPRALGRLLGVNQTLKHLSVQSNCISDGGLRAIVTGWTGGGEGGNTSRRSMPSALTSLDLSINPVGDSGQSGAGMRELASLLAQSSCPLRSLSLTRCNLGEDGVTALLQCLPLSPRLRHLSLLGNHAIRPEHVGQLVDAYAKSRTLVELEVDDLPHITRDDALAAAYRRAKAGNFAREVSEASGLPLDLATVVAEFALDIKKKPTLMASARREEHE